MKTFLITVAAASLMTMGAAAQTQGQASGSTNSSANVQAGQTNANVNSNTSANANAQSAGRHTNASGNGSANNSGSASVNGNSVNTDSSAAGSLASGTTIPATLTKPIDARKAKAGDEVAAKTTQDVRSDSGVVIPRGSRLVGHVTDAKAKANGDAESTLGIAFDHAVLRNGQHVPLNASIKALAAASNATSATMGDDNFGTAGSSAVGTTAAPAVGGGGRGGLLGGAGNAVGGATNTVGGVANGVGNTAGSLGANAGGAVSGATNGAAGQLSSQSQGVVGLNGLSLNSAASSATQGSVITSAGKDVKLDSGTQMLLQVNQQ
jgi:hypothetical protein